MKHIMKLQDLKKKKVHIITQNIDDLHERSGSSKVLHLHGNIRFAKSSGPNQEKYYYPIKGWELKEDDLCPEGYQLRPHVVWFGESVPQYENAIKVLSNADILIVIGTSLQVYPAASLINYAKKAKQKFLIDPKGKNLTVQKDFKLIDVNASKGIKIVREILTL